MKRFLSILLLLLPFIQALAQNTAPTAVITEPDPDIRYKPLTSVYFEGYGSDPDADQQTQLEYNWDVELWRDGSLIDTSEPEEVLGYPISQGYFNTLDDRFLQEDDFYRLRLTVTDMHGATGSTYVDILRSQTSLVILQSNPGNLKMTIDGDTVTTIHADTSEIGSQRTIGAVTPQTLNGVTYAFSNWTHGGPVTQTITTPEINTIYRANFSTPLVGSWRTTDVGMVNVSGSASHSNGTFSLTGSGKDIWEQADAFRCIYRSVEGNVDIRARVTGLTYSHHWAKAGVMIRNSMDPKSKHAMTVITPSNGASFQQRVETGKLSTATGTPTSAPTWVRLVRIGNIFTSYISSNGTNWTMVGTPVTVSMYNRVYVALVVTSHTQNNTVCTATMTNVSVSTPVSAASLGDAELVEIEEDSFQVYPNPVSGNSFHVRLRENTIGKLQIVNMLGQVHYQQILDENIESGEVEVATNTFPKGVYLVRVSEGDKVRVKSVLLR